MVIAIGNVQLSSLDLLIPDLLPSSTTGYTLYPFIGGGGEIHTGPIFGTQFSMQAILDTTTIADELRGSFTWEDILALSALPDSPQVIHHPKITDLGLAGLTALLDKQTLDTLRQYDAGRGEIIDPSPTVTYPGTDMLLQYYGVLKFWRF